MLMRVIHYYSIIIQYYSFASRCGSFIFTAGMLHKFCAFSDADGHLDPSWCRVDILVHRVGKSLVRAESEEWSCWVTGYVYLLLYQITRCTF